MSSSKKSFQITTPRGSLYRTENGTVKLEWNPDFTRKKSDSFGKAQEFVDSECLRYMDPLTPFLTGYLKKSGTLGTVIGSGEIQYLAPYARRQYYGHKTKAKWFETMKGSHKEEIIKGATRIAAGK